MSQSSAQVSVSVSQSTKHQLDRFSRERGLKKNYIVEQAILEFMQSRHELPDEAFIPSKMVLSDEGFDEVLSSLDHPGEPTEALRALMQD